MSPNYFMKKMTLAKAKMTDHSKLNAIPKPNTFDHPEYMNTFGFQAPTVFHIKHSNEDKHILAICIPQSSFILFSKSKR